MTKVLYVDHNLKRIAELNDLLAHDYNIESAFTGWEGLGAAMLYKPDIMLLNLHIPVMDGLELLRLLRTEEKLNQLPVLSFCDPSDDQMENEALKRTCAGIVKYPFDKQILTELIEKYVPSTTNS